MCLPTWITQTPKGTGEQQNKSNVYREPCVGCADNKSESDYVCLHIRNTQCMNGVLLGVEDGFGGCHEVDGVSRMRYGEREQPGLHPGRAYRGGTEGVAWRALCRSDHVLPQGTWRPAFEACCSCR